MPIRRKRAYDKVDESDGYRILVDRIWPRGISKKELQLDEWLKEVAPSDELRTWFSHDPDKFERFKERYFEELDNKEHEIARLAEMTTQKMITLVYGAKDRKHNQAVVLQEYIESR